MIQMSAFFSSIPNTAADQQIIAVAAGSLKNRDNALVVPPELPRLLSGMFIGTNMTTAKFKPASYRRFGDYWVLPYALASGTAGNIMPYLDLSDNPQGGPPLILDPSEELPAYGQQSSAGAQNAYAFVLFGHEGAKRHAGKFFTVRGVGSSTLTANTWSPVVFTMDTGLPAGRYNLVGARVKSAGLLAFRFVIAKQWNRPGGYGTQNDQSFEAQGQRNGWWGVWGSFDHLSIPVLEAFSTTADTSETVWLDLEQTSQNP